MTKTICENEITQSFFDSALDLLCVMGTDGYFRKVNPAWTSHLGWTSGELLSQYFMEFIHPDDRIFNAEIMEKLLQGKAVGDYEIRYRAKDGQYHWLQWRSSLSADNPELVFATARDITEAKQHEIRASHQIRLLEMAEQTARVGHWRLDSFTGTLEWSDEVFNIYGRRANKPEISLDDFVDAFTPEHRKELWTLVENSIQNGSEIDTELDLIRANGELRNVIVRAVCEKDDNEVVIGLFGIIQDVTQERQHQSNLQSKEELLSMAFKATSDGIWDWDLRTDQVWYSPQWMAQLGYENDELRNSFETWQELIFIEDRQKALNALEDHVRGKSDRYEMVQRYRHKDGHTVFILERAFAIRDSSGRAIRLVGAHTDITELKKLEQAKSEFTSIVSHELRTPLTAIHGAIGLLKGHYGPELPDQVRSLVDVANNNSERLILLVNDILDMEKLQSGRMDFDLREISLGEFLHQSVDNHEGYAKQFNVTLDYDAQADNLVVMGDSDRLMQVMSNLLSNAIKFSHEGETVKIRAQMRTDKVVISIIDHGVGISANMIEKIFDKFIQADSSDRRHKGGTGLGLSISKAMVEHMGGTISVISKEGEGSTFSITLPQS